ncbi:DUF2269 domain-containing protein [Ideonella sp. DXS29W]|uniref:DUF2269 domain-containing protein n=1 Tax=Ideonella lacteola TaxID=2984193 RepID=A0ABU9BS92_9BURK
MTYLLLKWTHIVSSTLLFGTGIGSAYYMLMASLSRDVRAIAVVVRLVVLADWIFTTTAIIVQPVTGLWLASLAGWPWTTPWIAASIALYMVAGACWLPVVWLQLRMRDMACTAAQAGEPLPPEYGRYLRYWVLLGIPAFAALVVVFFLMVAKPT